MSHQPPVVLTLERIAVAHQLAAMAPALPGDDSNARSTFAMAVEALGCPWPMPEGALLGMRRVAARETVPYLAQLAYGVGSALHGRPQSSPQPSQAHAAGRIAALVSFLPGGDSPEREGLYRLAGLLLDSGALGAGLGLAKNIAAGCPGTPMGALAHGAALALCAPDLDTILAELRFWSPTRAAAVPAPSGQPRPSWH